MKKITVLGEGHFGTAIATVLAYNGHEVTLWCYDKEVAQSINASRVNTKYFPDLILSKNIKATNNIQEAIADSEFIFEAIPVKFLRSVLQSLKAIIKKEQTLVLLSKGIEQDSLLFPSQMVKEILPVLSGVEGPGIDFAVVSGPSFAKELVEQKFTAVNMAVFSPTGHPERALEASRRIENKFFKTKITDDVIGLEICGALKNVMTIAMGIAKGANFADNTQAYLFTKGLSEIALLTEKLGGKKETVYDLAGVGDLMLCAFGASSRNLWFGKEIGQGKKLQEILQQSNITVEGLNTLQSIKQLAKKLDIQLPLCNAVYEIVFENKEIDILLKGNK